MLTWFADRSYSGRPGIHSQSLRYSPDIRSCVVLSDAGAQVEIIFSTLFIPRPRTALTDEQEPVIHQKQFQICKSPARAFKRSPCLTSKIKVPGLLFRSPRFVACAYCSGSSHQTSRVPSGPHCGDRIPSALNPVGSTVSAVCNHRHR